MASDERSSLILFLKVRHSSHALARSSAMVEKDRGRDVFFAVVNEGAMGGGRRRERKRAYKTGTIGGVVGVVVRFATAVV